MIEDRREGRREGISRHGEKEQRGLVIRKRI